MFTGIIERTAKVAEIIREGSNFHFWLESPIAAELKIDQSMAHDGVCLTVVRIEADRQRYMVTAMEETMQRSNLRTWEVGTEVNLERSMPMDGRFDGHIVQGHVDQTARCTAKEDAGGSWYFTFAYEPQGGGLCTVEKGSVAVNGVSLTVCDSEKDSFRVAIIPYTFEHPNFSDIKVGTRVNIEFDIIGKYIARIASV